MSNKWVRINLEREKRRRKAEELLELALDAERLAQDARKASMALRDVNLVMDKMAVKYGVIHE